VGVDRQTADLPDQPVVGQLLRPIGIDDEPGRDLALTAIGIRLAREQLPDAESEERYDE